MFTSDLPGQRWRRWRLDPHGSRQTGARDFGTDAAGALRYQQAEARRMGLPIDADLHTVHRRNERRSLRAQGAILLAYAAVIGATLAFAHITDRAAQGVTDCRALHLPQCPEFLR